jgi:predicted component of type VI protein secretion system
MVLGRAGYGLGNGAHLGERIHDRTGSFVIEIGPVPYDTFTRFFPYRVKPADSEDEDTEEYVPLGEQIHELVLCYLRDPLDFVIEVILDTEKEEWPLLGEAKTLLGRGAWLGERSREPIRIAL